MRAGRPPLSLQACQLHITPPSPLAHQSRTTATPFTHTSSALASSALAFTANVSAGALPACAQPWVPDGSYAVYANHMIFTTTVTSIQAHCGIISTEPSEGWCLSAAAQQLEPLQMPVAHSPSHRHILALGLAVQSLWSPLCGPDAGRPLLSPPCTRAVQSPPWALLPVCGLTAPELGWPALRTRTRFVVDAAPSPFSSTVTQLGLAPGLRGHNRGVWWLRARPPAYGCLHGQM
ncbi:hypothetical protein PLICRDRAFT_181116 [Plicaturopsis crispa FD-325 SS-3]|uniref:Uncharacterized protein n=1 Tax=Plicaturopsis crispa FD-325 SS-3 TaxID=944288 RepID=A0A0C9SV21_PLICR|nr:hypothetical protein PLICRDRAFT_181116 [Plicaturopsis crispa FD-325 SS-3]